MAFEDVRGALNLWVSTGAIQKQIKQRFGAYLDQVKDENAHLVYKQRISDMCIGG